MTSILKAVSRTALGVVLATGLATAAAAETGAEIAAKSKAAKERLYASTPAARSLGAKAKAVPVFPDIAKAGFVAGGDYGTGALFKGSKVVGY
jgi:lipid-binding SYLF domain-containing protein